MPPLVYGDSRIARADSTFRPPKKINFRPFDNFVSASAQDSFEHEHAKTRGFGSNAG
jgi:hypothetical protein